MTDAELDDRLGETLVARGGLSASNLERARLFQRTRNSTLAGALHELHVVTEDVLQACLEELTGVRAVDPRLMTVYPDFIAAVSRLIPSEVIRGIRVFPAQVELNAIHVCMVNPTDGWTARSIEAIAGCRVVPMVTHEAAIAEVIAKHFPASGAGSDAVPADRSPATVEVVYRQRLAEPIENLIGPARALLNRTRDAIARDPLALESVIRDPQLIRLVHQIICRAVESGASDIHIEPTGDALRVRVRIDGAMQTFAVLPASAAVPVVARLKAMADLPIAPATAPLDGRVGYDLVWGRGIDLRFSLVPSVTGENVVLRVLDRSRQRRQLTDLGVDDTVRRQLERALELPNGLILVTGPTGSGKSTTLYALLDCLNREDASIVTAEDPIESRIVGVTQVPCDESSGVTFPTALRGFLRQDPDVIMVGEIRDADTADLALKAALTGHLVLSSLHTNDAPGAVLRLLNMGLESFLISSAVRLVIAQRLIRRLCRECRVGIAPESAEHQNVIRRLPTDAQRLLSNVAIYTPGGCPACHRTGYHGRAGIFELLRVTEAIEDLIVRRAPTSEIRACARHEGMRTLRQAGLLKVADGETSLAEVLEHTVEDPV
ncbi:MAG: ATPase, T2SS/T4P/T4SS family [Acidobacteria bacterium]|nr:ATPase, T2SS/T4P/T4SS family [Acidobacteriota bacterium]